MPSSAVLLTYLAYWISQMFRYQNIRILFPTKADILGSSVSFIGNWRISCVATVVVLFPLVWVELVWVRQWRNKATTTTALMWQKVTFCLSKCMMMLTVPVAVCKVWRVCTITATRATLTQWFRHCPTGMYWYAVWVWLAIRSLGINLSACISSQKIDWSIVGLQQLKCCLNFWNSTF